MIEHKAGSFEVPTDVADAARAADEYLAAAQADGWELVGLTTVATWPLDHTALVLAAWKRERPTEPGEPFVFTTS